MKVYTHVDVDLDNASSVALALLKYNKLTLNDIIFVSGNFDGKEMVGNDIALDIEAGGKGEKGNVISVDGRIRVLSAFSLFLGSMDTEYQDAFEDLSIFIDAIDSTGTWALGYDLDGVDTLASLPTLEQVFFAVKHQFKDDLTVTMFWSKIIQGFWKRHKSDLRASTEATKAKWPYERIAIMSDSSEPTTMGRLFRQGADFVIYENGYNLGVKRSNALDIDLSYYLKDMLPDWFHHKAGFLSCWGSKKAPQTAPTYISAEKLADMVSTIKYNRN